MGDHVRPRLADTPPAPGRAAPTCRRTARRSAGASAGAARSGSAQRIPKRRATALTCALSTGEGAATAAARAASVRKSPSLPRVVPVRDPKVPHGPVLAVGAGAWSSFVGAIGAEGLGR
ncbi:DUF397 domain-containing protein [Streptomyces sp. NPDC096153]|uniref:DUF397 domain-containing protein n=1 Tax=Streptomyces sp. NPDC096153 TaxID=3155548 RepID=UPI00332E8B10